MRFVLIADTHDTVMGMRLAGVAGAEAHTPEEVREALERAIADPEVGIVMISPRLAAMQQAMVDRVRLHSNRPLIVEVPDRHVGETAYADKITGYIQEAIGVKI